MKLRTLKLMLSWLLLAICALGVAAIFMNSWKLLLVFIGLFLVVWAVLAVVEWKQWYQMARSIE